MRDRLLPIKNKALALHAKAMVIDTGKVFIGSANLNPRSIRINTEVGLLIESAALNTAVRSVIAPDIDAKNALQLQYDDKGQIVWKSDDQMLTVQPATSLYARYRGLAFQSLAHRERVLRRIRFNRPGFRLAVRKGCFWPNAADADLRTTPIR